MNKDCLKILFFKAARTYTANVQVINEQWEAIECAYAQKNRHYHSLNHLELMFEQLSELENQVQDVNSLVFAVFYHDIIYNVNERDNEEQSAEFAATSLAKLHVPKSCIAKCVRMILATKLHASDGSIDTNFLLDADLCILGMSCEIYSSYTVNVRKEYSIYPDEVYNAGRATVLKHFLATDRLYKTEYFYGKYENAARQNMAKELVALSLL